MTAGAALGPRLDVLDDGVLLLELGDGENRFTPDVVERLHELLDRACAAPAPTALVTTARGKYFSNGLDLAWMGERPGRREQALRALHGLLARLLELPLPTVAAVQGHAFAGGAMVALAHDVTVMRDGRGFWCLPEVPSGLAFTVGMTALLRARLPVRTAHTAMTTGRRYGGAEALAAGIVDATAPTVDEVRTGALARARELAPTAHPALGTVRSRLHGPVIRALREDTFGSKENS